MVKRVPARSLNDWSLRVLVANGLDPDEASARVLAAHLQRFVAFARANCESFDLRTSISRYRSALENRGSAPSAATLSAIRHSLSLFVRVVSAWRWESDRESGRLRLRFCFDTPTARRCTTPASTFASAAGAHPRTGEWTEALRRSLRVHHFSPRTVALHVELTRRYLAFLGPKEPEASSACRFLEHLAVDARAPASTQNEALSALGYFLRRVLGQKVDETDLSTPSGRRQRRHAVLSPDEVQRLLAVSEGGPGLMLRLLYGAGLRAEECASLRVGDLAFEQGQLHVRGARGVRERVVMLPEATRELLRVHLERLRVVWEADRATSRAEMRLPDNARGLDTETGRNWEWQWLFPARRPARDSASGLERREHLSTSALHKAVKVAARRAGITKTVTCHMLRHSFAAHLLDNGADLPTLRELLGHRQIRSTRAYAERMQPLDATPRSPLDTWDLPAPRRAAALRKPRSAGR